MAFSDGGVARSAGPGVRLDASDVRVNTIRTPATRLGRRSLLRGVRCTPRRTGYMKSARALTRTFADILRTAQPPIYPMHPVPMQHSSYVPSRALTCPVLSGFRFSRMRSKSSCRSLACGRLSRWMSPNDSLAFQSGSALRFSTALRSSTDFQRPESMLPFPVFI